MRAYAGFDTFPARVFVLARSLSRSLSNRAHWWYRRLIVSRARESRSIKHWQRQRRYITVVRRAWREFAAAPCAPLYTDAHRGPLCSFHQTPHPAACILFKRHIRVLVVPYRTMLLMHLLPPLLLPFSSSFNVIHLPERGSLGARPIHLNIIDNTVRRTG